MPHKPQFGDARPLHLFTAQDALTHFIWRHHVKPSRKHFRSKTPRVISHPRTRAEISAQLNLSRIFEQCHAKLIALGVRPSSITKVYDAGRQTSKRGVFATKALWEFAVENKESGLRLIELLSPYLRHEKRRADMERVRQNVEWRNSDAFKRDARDKRVQANKRTNDAKK